MSLCAPESHSPAWPGAGAAVLGACAKWSWAPQFGTVASRADVAGSRQWAGAVLHRPAYGMCAGEAWPGTQVSEGACGLADVEARVLLMHHQAPFRQQCA